jgi:hypothetical protein
MVVRGAGFHQRRNVGAGGGGGQVNSVFLCHFDGTNGQTTYTDVYGNAMTNHGAALTTTNPKFGTASLNLTGNYVSVAHNSNFVPTGDFTIEGWLNYTSGNNYVLIAKRSGTGVTAWFLLDLFSGIFAYVAQGGMTQIGNSVATPTAGTWHHFAIVRSGTNCMFFWDGVQQGATLTGVSGSITDNGDAITIGASGTDGSLQANAVQMDDIRISNVARYTTNFTPPSAAFTF